jgi:hypothetical protein
LAVQAGQRTEAEVEQSVPLPTALLALPAIETTVNVETAPEAAPLPTVTGENDELINDLPVLHDVVQENTLTMSDLPP